MLARGPALLLTLLSLEARARKNDHAHEKRALLADANFAEKR